MASSRWWYVSLVALVVFASDASAQKPLKTPRTTAAPPAREQRPKQPTARPKQPTARPTEEAPLQKCEVAEAERVRCGAPDITASQCETINCCFDGRQCYYGKAVTVQCTRDGQFVVVVARESTVPSIELASVSLLGGEGAACRPVDASAAFIIFQFHVTACDTRAFEDESALIYENQMTSSYQLDVGQRGTITRDSHFELLFQCRYSSSAVEALVIQVNPAPPPAPVTALGPLRMELRLASGQCFTKGCVQDEEAYRSFYSAADYPVSKVLKQPVYAEVRILDRTDPDLVLTLEHCWASTTTDPLSLPAWDLLLHGCPYSDDRYLTTVLPVDDASGLQFPSHHKRFVLQMFAFVDQDTSVALNERVFIHCTAAVCYPTQHDSCVQRCSRRRRAVSGVKGTEHRDTVSVSSGEVILIDQTLTDLLQNNEIS